MPSSHLEPARLLVDGDLVIARIQSDDSVRATRRHVVYEDAPMLFHFDGEGRVCRFAHRVDTHHAWRALHDG